MILYATFPDAERAARAAGALLDHGADPKDVSLIPADSLDADARGHLERVARQGITHTTAEDIRVGAIRGLTFGTLLGVVGAIGSIIIPGFGLVASAVPAAIGAAVGTAAAGAFVGGASGALIDLGAGGAVETRYAWPVDSGSAVVAVCIPSGRLGEAAAEAVMFKYGADGLQRSDGVQTSDEQPAFGADRGVCVTVGVRKGGIELLQPFVAGVVEIPETREKLVFLKVPHVVEEIVLGEGEPERRHGTISVL